MKIILASASPRREELMQLITDKFEIKVSEVEEKLESNLTPEEQVIKLAYLKAKKVFEQIDGDRIVIGSDTIVVKDSKIYGKPINKKHAKQMIKELIEGDKTHHIITGLSVIIQKDGKIKEYKTFDKVKIYFKEITDQEIDWWINTGKAMDKARSIWNTK